MGCRSAASATLLVGGIVLGFETMLATLINQPPITTIFQFHTQPEGKTDKIPTGLKIDRKVVLF